MKTKKITLEIPKDMRLGQAIMNAYRDQWECDYRGNSERMRYWDIWRFDTNSIQREINKLNK